MSGTDTRTSDTALSNPAPASSGLSESGNGTSAGAWLKGKFQIAMASGVYWREGFASSHLGMFIDTPAKTPTWSLTHLNTGLRVCVIVAREKQAISIAKEIAALGDWSFEKPKGIARDLAQRAAAYINANDFCIRENAASHPNMAKTARKILATRKSATEPS